MRINNQPVGRLFGLFVTLLILICAANNLTLKTKLKSQGRFVFPTCCLINIWLLSLLLLLLLLVCRSQWIHIHCHGQLLAVELLFFCTQRINCIGINCSWYDSLEGLAGNSTVKRISDRVAGLEVCISFIYLWIRFKL